MTIANHTGNEHCRPLQDDCPGPVVGVVPPEQPILGQRGVRPNEKGIPSGVDIYIFCRPMPPAPLTKAEDSYDLCGIDTTEPNVRYSIIRVPVACMSDGRHSIDIRKGSAFQHSDREHVPDRIAVPGFIRGRRHT